MVWGLLTVDSRLMCLVVGINSFLCFIFGILFYFNICWFLLAN